MAPNTCVQVLGDEFEYVESEWDSRAEFDAWLAEAVETDDANEALVEQAHQDYVDKHNQLELAKLEERVGWAYSNDLRKRSANQQPPEGLTEEHINILMNALGLYNVTYKQYQRSMHLDHYFKSMLGPDDVALAHLALDLYSVTYEQYQRSLHLHYYLENMIHPNTIALAQHQAAKRTARATALRVRPDFAELEVSNDMASRSTPRSLVDLMTDSGRAEAAIWQARLAHRASLVRTFGTDFLDSSLLPSRPKQQAPPSAVTGATASTQAAAPTEVVGDPTHPTMHHGRDASTSKPTEYTLDGGPAHLPGTVAYYKRQALKKAAVPPPQPKATIEEHDDGHNADDESSSVKNKGRRKSLVMVFGRTNVRRATASGKVHKRMQKRNKRA
ncbi:hypothetical protein N0V83_006765 [Neocucurbitaria cava]|uniref:Uncharacterized protein n=1 Tax=Neocucurbitaria cava TaxID=798079 RepID=A0A9W8Y6K5_9PLEO|nr:hypothetical protein N0V83_006765 [Neocucurbitaria cava]